MRHTKTITLGAASAVALVALLATCARAPKMPAVDGAVIEIRRSDGALRPRDPGYASTLQLYWFGTACHLIQLGEARVLTDPFVTNDFKLRGLRSDQSRVAATFGRIAPPDMVLVNHTHLDHILDAYTAMSLPAWRDAGVLLYGGSSAKHLLAGWADTEVDGRCQIVPDGGGLLPTLAPSPGYSTRVTAFRSDHSPHLKCGFTAANGTIDKPRTSPPHRIFDFQTGEVFNYLVELRAPGASFNVFYLGAPFHLDQRPDSLPPQGTPIDVAIVLAPSADNVRGYPEEHLARLRPRHIVLSHFNTFTKEDPDEQLNILGLDSVKMPKLSRDLQATFAGKASDYPEFEKLHIPAITVMSRQAGGARNVIQIR